MNSYCFHYCFHVPTFCNFPLNSNETYCSFYAVLSKSKASLGPGDHSIQGAQGMDHKEMMGTVR